MRICTYNIQGGIDPENNPTGAAVLFEDFKTHKVEIAVLQEVRVKQDRYFGQQHEEDPANNGIIYAIAGKHENKAKRYGQGFYVSAKWRPHYVHHEYISDRISIIQLNLNIKNGERDCIMTIINVYAPHSGYLIDKPEEVAEYYELLATTYARFNTNTLVLIAGDFNSKLGQRTEDDTTKITGRYGKGTRNKAGEKFAEFLEENRLIATNTLFRQSIHKRITWTGHLSGKMVYNQIDFTLIDQQKRHLVTQSTTTRMFLYDSDHFPVITTFDLRGLYRTLERTRSKGGPDKLEYNKLTESAGQAYFNEPSGFTYGFQKKVESEIAQIITDGAPDDLNKRITKTLQKVARKEIPKVIPLNSPLFPLQDEKIRREIKEIQKIKREMTFRRNVNYRERQNMQKQIRTKKKRVKHMIGKLRKKNLLEQIDNLEKNKGNTKIYAINKAITHAQEFKPLRVTTADGKITDKPDQIRTVASEFYHKLFTTQLCNEGAEADKIEPFQGFFRPLHRPFDEAEIFEATRKLRNGRTTGPDGLKGELLRYGGYKMGTQPSTLYKLKAKVFNRIFETHTKLQTIHTSDLTVLNKPNKPPMIEDTRGITLHNIDRKLLEILLLIRIAQTIDKFLGNEQCGYRPGRSTTEVLFCHRWLTAICQRYLTRFNIMGIDLSKAFDCVIRAKLYEMLVPILAEDELRIMRILFSDTDLTVKAGGERSDPFSTTIGIPQGGGLSPIFFILYLQMSMENFERTKLPRPTSWLYLEPTYADDKDCVIEYPFDANLTPEEIHAYKNPHLLEFSRLLEPHLKEYNLKVNLDKLEWTVLDSKELRAKDVRKLGTRIGETKELGYRTRGASNAFRSQRRFFNNSGKLPLNTRMRVYNCYVLPMFAYNIAVLGLTDIQMKSLDVLHRKHLRIVSRIFYPKRIRNIDLYALTKSVPITTLALQYRWKFFGHILRQPTTNPAYIIMNSYFNPNSGRQHRPGRIHTNLPIRLNQDLELTTGLGRPMLESLEDLEALRKFAQGRKEWKQMVKEMVMKHSQPATDKTPRTTRKRERQKNKNEMRKKRKECKKRIIWNEAAEADSHLPPDRRHGMRRLTPHETPRLRWNPQVQYSVSTEAARQPQGMGAAARRHNNEPIVNIHHQDPEAAEVIHRDARAEDRRAQAAMWHLFH